VSEIDSEKSYLQRVKSIEQRHRFVMTCLWSEQAR
jgi:hypothetical protein